MTLTLYHLLRSSLLGDLAHDMLVKPDIIRLGYTSCNKANNEMCLHFIAKYVSQLFTKGKIRKWLDEHPTLTFLSMITPSDYAFVATLMKNSEPVWSAKPGDDTSPVKPLYTSGGKLKREFSGHAWSEEGMLYYKRCQDDWIKTIHIEGIFKELIKNWTQLLEDKNEYAYLKKKATKYASSYYDGGELVSLNKESPAEVPIVSFGGLDVNTHDEVRIVVDIINIIMPLKLTSVSMGRMACVILILLVMAVKKKAMMTWQECQNCQKMKKNYYKNYCQKMKKNYYKNYYRKNVKVVGLMVRVQRRKKSN
jgi:hypothetical protein